MARLPWLPPHLVCLVCLPFACVAHCQDLPYMSPLPIDKLTVNQRCNNIIVDTKNYSANEMLM